MPLVMRQGTMEVRIIPMDEPKLIHCYDGDWETAPEVVIDLDSLLVEGYGDSKKLPTGKFLLEALQTIHRYHAKLLKQWDEINS